jgi:xanthine dehydrogenase accessory factor
MPDPSSKASFKLINDAVERVLNSGDVAALATLIEAPLHVGAKLFIEGTGQTTGTMYDDVLDRAVSSFASVFLESREEAKAYAMKDLAPDKPPFEGRVLFERIQPELRIVICGAGHVGAALAKLASFVGYHATLIDDRSEFVTRGRFPEEQIELITAQDWTESVRQAIGDGRGVAVAVVTRGHNEDEACMEAVVSTNPDYIGLIGSKRRTNIVLDRLRQTGAPEKQLRKVRAPVGLDIGAVTPEEVALAIIAEIVADRRGGKGGSLSEWRRRD